MRSCPRPQRTRRAGCPGSRRLGCCTASLFDEAYFFSVCAAKSNVSCFAGLAARWPLVMVGFGRILVWAPLSHNHECICSLPVPWLPPRQATAAHHASSFSPVSLIWSVIGMILSAQFNRSNPDPRRGALPPPLMARHSRFHTLARDSPSKHQQSP
jgi:hypothetical protein